MAGSSSTTRTVAWSAMSHLSPGQGERESRAAARRALDPDATAVSLDDGLADGKADTTRLAAFAASKRLEEPLALPIGNADTFVADAHLDHAFPPASVDPQRRTVGSMARRVLEQVRQQLVELAVVAVDK